MNIQNFTPTAWLFVGIVSLTGCVSTGVVHYPEQDRRVIQSGPPGQVKKIYGDRSARDYAHGRDRHYGYRTNGYYPLIIIRTPDIIIRQAGDGRFFYQNRDGRSEEHTSELQSHHDLVCRLLLEKKKKS